MKVALRILVAAAVLAGIWFFIDYETNRQAKNASREQLAPPHQRPISFAVMDDSYRIETQQHDGHKFVIYRTSIIHHPGCECLKSK